MTIDQAIKRLERIAECQDEDWLDYEYLALKLGIEALKWVKSVRAHMGWELHDRLPGETEE